MNLLKRPHVTRHNGIQFVIMVALGVTLADCLACLEVLGSIGIDLVRLDNTGNLNNLLVI